MKTSCNSFLRILAARFWLSSASLMLLAGCLEAAPVEGPSQEEFQNRLKLDASALASTGRKYLSYADAVDSVRQTVVQINSLVPPKIPPELEPYLDDPRVMRYFPQYDLRRNPGEVGLGSGFVVTADGYIVTNNHVVEGASAIVVTFPSQEKIYPATIVGRDPQTEIALIKIEAQDLPVATLADSSKVRVGDIALAIGSPLGLSDSVTMGIVSALGRDTGRVDVRGGGSGRDGRRAILGVRGYENFIQTDAAINGGNSGGPLVDGLGRVIGVNTFIFSGNGSAGGNIGLGFAVPINMAVRITKDLADDGKVQRGWLGITMAPVTRERAIRAGLDRLDGVVISKVVVDSAAGRAGIRRDDILLEIDGKQIKGPLDLRLKISSMRPGETSTVGIVRNGKGMILPITIGSREDLEEG